MKELRVGIIGLGRIAPMHVKSLDLIKGVKIVAGCDINEEKFDLLKDRKGVNFYTSYEQMIDRENLDAVHICLPHYLHTIVSRYAIEKGVAVLCEKPMAIDFESAEELVRFAEERSLLYGVIFQCRYNPSVQLVKKALNDNKLGKIISASSILTWCRTEEYYSHDDWHGTWDKEGGGVIINQTIHSIDMVNYFVNSPVKKVDCTMHNRMLKNIEVEDTAEGLVLYENGVKYLFYATNLYGDNPPIRVSLFCEKGSVECDYDNAIITYNDGSKEEFHRSSKTNGIQPQEKYWGTMHVKQIEQFYRALRGEEALDISGREALKTHKLICEIYKKGRKTL